MQSVTIVGIGRVGGSLALALSRAGYRVENLIYRTSKTAKKIARKISPPPKTISFNSVSSIDSDLVFITSQDSELGSVVAGLASKITRKPFVFHTSGSLSSAVLSDMKKRGCPTGSIHPLISISSADFDADRFAGAFFCVEGDAEALKRGKAIVRKIRGKPFSIETKYKTLYHAAAVTACGHLVAVVDTAIEMMTKCGLSTNESRKVLMPLIKSTVDNLETQRPEQALTGTFARADLDVFERQLASIKGNLPKDVLEIYLLLAERSLKLAEKNGVSKERTQKLRKRILLAKRLGK